ncbi:acyltransferase family protein [Peribacillus frigoritolerans]|uniref:acyltransferase family protein n=1 Tax=Peribacillus frigoritolerans TaxID=450367 RepID=UPI002162ED5F|nr:acyltransferase [Peribacillus frigoritolerans]
MLNKKERLTELDALRGIAALAVVLYHYTTRYNINFPSVRDAIFFDFKFGFLGVQLFFIISGFVIIMTLERVDSIKDYAIRRSTRLYPAYITGVILTFTLVSIFGLNGRETSIPEALVNLTMLQGMIPGVIPHVDGVYWSLTVELIFYVIMGLLFVFGFIKKIEIPLVIWLGISFLIKGISMNYESIILTAINFYGIMDYCNLFIAGIMFFKLRSSNLKRYHLIIFACLIYDFVFNGSISGTAVLVFFMVFYALIYGKLKFLNFKPLIYLGTISYSLYLVHQNIGYMILNKLGDYGFTNEIFIIIPIFVSIVIASLITFYVEKPLQLILKRKSNKEKQTKKKLVS